MQTKINSLLVIITVAVVVNAVLQSCKKDIEIEKTVPTERVIVNAETPRHATGLLFKQKSKLKSLGYATPPQASTLASSVDLSGYMPPYIIDQGQLPCCVGCAVSELKNFHEKLEKGYKYTNILGALDYSKLFSPSYIYSRVKLSNDCSSGAYIEDALDLLINEGVATWKEQPFINYTCPTIKSSTDAKNYKIERYAPVNYTDITTVKNFLAAKIPIIIGAVVDNNFMIAQKNSNGLFIWKVNSTKEVGGHALLVLGYDDTKNAFLVINSWGDSWGNKGYVWVDYAKFKLAVQVAYVTYDIINTSNQTLQFTCIPVIKTYPAVPTAPLICGAYKYNGNKITAAISSIDQTNISFTMKRYPGGSKFEKKGTMYVKESTACGSILGEVAYDANSTEKSITIKHGLQAGSKKDYVIVIKSVTNDRYYTSKLSVTVK